MTSLIVTLTITDETASGRWGWRIDSADTAVTSLSELYKPETTPQDAYADAAIGIGERMRLKLFRLNLGLGQ